MTVVLHDLVGAGDQRFSPHCWRIRMALAHKGLPCEARATRFCDISAIGDGRFKTIPVIEDRGELIGDSWTIAQYLEEAYPDLPSLFGGHGGQELTRFVQSWCAGVLHAGLAPLIILDIFEQLVPEDQPQFRASREARFGRSLEDVQAGRQARLEGFRNSLEPLRRTLQGVAYLGGDRPHYADYVVFGAFQWARTVSGLAVLEDDDPVKAWFERCLDLYDSLGRAMPAA